MRLIGKAAAQTYLDEHPLSQLKANLANALKLNDLPSITGAYAALAGHDYAQRVVGAEGTS